MMSEQISALKQTQLLELAAQRDRLRRRPQLKWLFFEITNACNLSCAHCGSRCTATGSRLQTSDVRKTLETLPDRGTMICLTGGEPTLHPDFMEIAHTVSGMGFYWGMTTNGTLIDDATAAGLRDAGMSTVSVSLDGMEASHDRLRGRAGAWRQAVRGIASLQDAGFSPQVTTVVHRGNFDELEQLCEFLSDLGIRSWRPINVEPIGRSYEAGNLMLSAAQFRKLLCFIRNKRFDSACPMEVTYGCSHYLGVSEERMVRDHYFQCAAGICVASVRASGDICACLDIENLPSLVQGNIHHDSFWNVWMNRFGVFRRDRTEDSLKCRSCKDRLICAGDSAHTWDWLRHEPLLCGKEIMEEDRLS